MQKPVAATEPFRVLLSEMRDRLYMTRKVLHQCLVHPNMNVKVGFDLLHTGTVNCA